MSTVEKLNIYQLIPKIMEDLGSIGKEKTNSHQGYKFRGIEDMYNNIHPIFVKHGVFCVPQVIETFSESFQSNKGTLSFRVRIRVNHKFYAPDGTFVEVIIAAEGIDTSDKATNKAMSAAMKYAFIELLSIPTADIDDADKTTPEIESGNAPKNFNQPMPNFGAPMNTPKTAAPFSPPPVRQAEPAGDPTFNYGENVASGNDDPNSFANFTPENFKGNGGQ